MKTEITNAHLIDPANNVDAKTNLYIDDNCIAAIGTAPSGWQSDLSIDAKGHYVFPGLVDIATRLREPGQEHKATIATETNWTALTCLKKNLEVHRNRKKVLPLLCNHTQLNEWSFSFLS